ncbi:PA0069 family radical SAM protein [Albimonas sp. CAU 1670]|uniref:PA0069 family radical SAM protein n=1 Tax=Albimonas sp. CAU 1670 TaxID=3032599 RepID=UPI0023DCACEC|nr:PA0069 family radical SAM protein [Albimonas sp. CAU 1670]MDF2234930.1 PA0069 family radical SAM protein [Albimonas sp. CAU 1670]
MPDLFDTFETSDPGAYGFAERAAVDAARRRGRGVGSNRSGRYERETRVAADDGWAREEEDEAPLRTEVLIDHSRSVIARNTSPDLPFDRSVNPYRGCEHGCTYCFARPTHAYLGLSPGLDFETRILVKPDAAERLAQELRAPGYECRPIAMGTNTDPYQPLERDKRVTRRILEVLRAHRHPVSIVTKGAGVTRDLDILGEMGRQGLARVYLSVTTLDHRLGRALEPRAASPQARLRAIAALARAGVPTGVMVAPVIPALTDHELERILEACARAGAVSAGYIVLRLPREVRDLFVEWLQEHRPDAAERVMGRVREIHGGRDYDAAFGRRLSGQGVWADLLRRRFQGAARRHGLDRRLPPLRTDLFRKPQRKGDQLALDL